MLSEIIKNEMAVNRAALFFASSEYMAKLLGAVYGTLKALLPKAKQQDELLQEAINCLKRVRLDFNGIDEVCKLAGVHPYTLCKKDIDETLEKITKLK